MTRMAVNRGEIVEIQFPLPNGGHKNHPTIVISNNDVYNNEQAFLAVMLSGKPVLDNFSFELDDSMVTKPFKKKTQVRCHLITIASESDIISRHGTLNGSAVTSIVNKICNNILR